MGEWIQYGALGILGAKLYFDHKRQMKADKHRNERQTAIDERQGKLEDRQSAMTGNHLEHMTASYDVLGGAITKLTQVIEKCRFNQEPERPS